MKLICLIILFSLYSLLTEAQRGSLTGKLIDESGKKMPLSTITIYHATDSSFITYRLSGNEGDFKVSGLPLNTKLRTIISFTGFETYRKEFMFSSTILLVRTYCSLYLQTYGYILIDGCLSNFCL